jgi:hypothetical protein
LGDRLKAPPLQPAIPDRFPTGRFRQFLRRRRFVARIDRAGADPGFKSSDNIVGKLRPVFWHFQMRIVMTDGADEQAFPRIAGRQRRTGISAGR